LVFMQVVRRSERIKYQLVSFTPEWQKAAERCNERLRACQPPPSFFLPRGDGGVVVRGPIRWEHWLVIDDTGEVRGGCLLQTQPAWVAGKETEAVSIQSPLSEGIVDRRHAALAVWMTKEVQDNFPNPYSVGMGSLQAPYARILKALRWRVELAPYYFRVLSGRRLLANVAPLRKHGRLGWAVRAGALVPFIPDVFFSALHRFRAARPGPSVDSSKPEWTRVRSRYGFAIDRSEPMLAALYGDTKNFLRLIVPGGLGFIRWTDCRSNPYFGDLRLATLLDAICEPGAELRLVQAATDAARDHGADLLMTNQMAPDIIKAVEQNGWLPYSSNFVVAFSPDVTKRIGSAPVFVTRGDGDALVHL
jgi:hypothetical protein